MFVTEIVFIVFIHCYLASNLYGVCVKHCTAHKSFCFNVIHLENSALSSYADLPQHFVVVVVLFIDWFCRIERLKENLRRVNKCGHVAFQGSFKLFNK